MIAEPSTAELKAQLSDPLWRIRNLYSIVTDEAQEMPLVPNPEQELLMRRLHNANLILKARQLGFTTYIDILALDQCLFNKNYTASIIAHSLPDAQKIFRNKVKKVYDSLPRLVQQTCPIRNASASEIVFENGSSISVGTSARGGTVQFLHVSEMGKIARKYPEKAAEIVSGAFEAVPVTGLKFVESTAEGRAGWFYEAVMEARRRKAQGSKDTPLDFRLHFFPWFKKAGYRLDPDGVVFTDSDRRYFNDLKAKLGLTLDRQQMAWYVKKRATLKDLMLREYPSTEDEAFQASVDGLIYAAEMKVLRLMGRIGKVDHRPGLVVNTFWDLGVNDRNSIWLHQRVGTMNRFLRFFQDHNKGMRHYWQLLEGWRVENGGRWGKHYLPHDGNARQQGAEVETRKSILEGLGAENVEIVPRISDIKTGIDLVKTMIPECEMDEEGCAEGIDAMDNYSREWDEHAGDWATHPRHDVYSNGADAFRQWAQAYKPGDNDLGRGVGMVLPASYGRAGY